jgi:hypothetical protein
LLDLAIASLYCRLTNSMWPELGFDFRL